MNSATYFQISRYQVSSHLKHWVCPSHRDLGENASVKYSLLKGRDSDGHGVFTVDALSGVVRTTTVLDHEDRAIYRLAVAATDGGDPPQQTVRLLRVEVLDLNDNRPTFTSSSLVFRVREDVRVGHVVGTVATSDPDHSNHVAGGQVTYTLTSVNSSEEEGTEPEDNSVLSAFDMDRTTGSLEIDILKWFAINFNTTQNIYVIVK
uniref:Cadherin domain-containing protein n=1 Tax=Timema bartmani TaxID=61472 RepID=A0A7R9EMI3_9NEOP|nr:unnamed protein product [Timema bartmani]